MSNKASMQTLAGLSSSRGFAIGPVFVYRGDGEIPIPEYTVEEGREGEELLRLDRARGATRRDIESLLAVLRERTGQEDVRVFECHLMILDDPTLVDGVMRLVREERLNAEAAVRRTVDGLRRQFARMNDAYFRERVRDLDDIERRLLKALTGCACETSIELKVPSIVVADDLTPSETVRLPREFLLGFATNGGSPTGHVALLARAMGVPAVSGLVDVTARVKPGETVLLDGTNGAITLHPDHQTILDFDDLVERQRERTEEAASGRPAGTLNDGGDIPLLANVHPGVPVGGLRDYGARGIGLYRSEYLWLGRELEPTEDEQFEAYRSVALLVKNLGETASVTIRLLDIGGDKLVRGITSKESNPFLGNRSLRYLLAHRDVLKTQMRAILRASAFGRVALLYPMVACLDELEICAAALAEAKAELDARGLAYDRALKVGAMIEIPSAALIADALAAHVDFFSIGTNDLVQYTMAADRSNESVAYLYQPLHPAVRRLVALTVEAARAHHIPVSVCGESAADLLCGPLWAAMGVDHLSMSASYIPSLSKLLSRLSRADLEDYRRTVETLGSDVRASDVVETCRAWMSAHVPDFEGLLI